MATRANSRSIFGKLLQAYRSARKLSELELTRLLLMAGYPIANGLISKYEYGLRRPPARFVMALETCMKLTGEERDALLDAVLVDMNSEYLSHLDLTMKKHFSKSIKEQASDDDKSRTLTNAIEQSEPRKPLKVFLCHSSADKKSVRKIYKRLLKEGFDPWLDEQDLIPGQNWDNEIQIAVRETHVVIVLLSRSSITKAGYVQKEIKYALDVADTQPEGAIFIIPARLEECDVPFRLKGLQWVDLFKKQGYGRLKAALEKRAKHL